MTTPLPHTAFISVHEWKLMVCALALSPRESEIARLILQGMDEVQIASALRIAPRTVHAHVERAYRKAGVHSRSDLVVRLFREYVRVRSDA
jgi:DNA-binding CsgD family transcriptional regulator